MGALLGLFVSVFPLGRAFVSALTDTNRPNFPLGRAFVSVRSVCVCDLWEGHSYHGRKSGYRCANLYLYPTYTLHYTRAVTLWCYIYMYIYIYIYKYIAAPSHPLSPALRAHYLLNPLLLLVGQSYTYMWQYMCMYVYVKRLIPVWNISYINILSHFSYINALSHSYTIWLICMCSVACQLPLLNSTLYTGICTLFESYHTCSSAAQRVLLRVIILWMNHFWYEW